MACLKILVVGGTRFVGRAVVEAALGHGHHVTLFNRGITNPDLFPGLETIRGDRHTEASKLTGRSFDVVIDIAGMNRGEVGPLIDVVQSTTRRFVFISTVSVSPTTRFRKSKDKKSWRLQDIDTSGELGRSRSFQRWLLGALRAAPAVEGGERRRSGQAALGHKRRAACLSRRGAVSGSGALGPTERPGPSQREFE
ncbi:MAG: NAD-dependent epimerase/dehydratase family protein [Nitrososphaerales archaeon]